MSAGTTITLLPQVVYNGTNPAFVGERQQAAGYYLGKKDLQTLSWKLVSVKANIIIQGTLEALPTEDDWADLYTMSLNLESQIDYINLTGNFVWMRVKVTAFQSGTIQYIRMSY